MSRNKKVELTVAAVFLVLVLAVAYIYNVYVTVVMTDTVYSVEEKLQTTNNEIVGRLSAENDKSKWDSIINEYEYIVISVKDSENKKVAESKNFVQKYFSIRVRTPFYYRSQSYLLESSVYLLNRETIGISALVEFILIELLIGTAAIILIAILIYALILRPFRKLFAAIEAYDKTGKLEKIKIKGYAGQVFDRFRELTENLESQQKNQMRIIASISHDIKTPLTSIMGYTEQLRKEGIPHERKKKYLDTVYAKSIDIQQLVHEFEEYLDFNHSHRLNIKHSDTKRIADCMVEEYESELEVVGVSLIVNNYAGVVKLDIDAQRLRRVVGNIFANSVKHFDTEDKIIRVDIYADKETVYFNIHDNGKGVSEEKLELIFEPLYTTDKGRKVAGLGLAICREIVEGHKGRIYAAQSDLGGLEVCMELPRANK